MASDTSPWTKHGPAAALAVEAAGLDWLRDAHGGPSVPAVLSADDDHCRGRLVIERVVTGPWTAASDERFGREMASLHSAGAPRFGWAEHPTGFIGPLAQSNEPAASWPTFYAERRVLPFVRRAVDDGTLDRQEAAVIEALCQRLPALAGPPEPPARLHGDLWRGNVLADRDGRPWIIDPAAHGGHRETDLAMMRLFGGFGEACYRAYDEASPLAAGWLDRVPLHQLHPLLVHAVLFGRGYANQAIAAGRTYC